ncbi:MAG: multiheme c-type cytochrome [Acidobacteriota bacterium]
MRYPVPDPRRGWEARLARLSMGVLLFEAASGLLIPFAPFQPAVQWGVLVHTLVGVLTLLPLAWYTGRHWADYRHYRFSHVVLLGYAGLAALLICAVSGVVLTWQGLLGVRTSVIWRQVHLISTFVTLGAVLPHIVVLLPRLWRRMEWRPAAGYLAWSAALGVAGMLLTFGLTGLSSGTRYVDRFPADYSFLYGEDRPFAPSLARTATGGAFDARSLAGSKSCGTSGCHEQILAEWLPSAHHYAAMDPLFQGIQKVMAKQNGAESTRYCGGCHDPISLFSGTKNVFVVDLTSLEGYNDGISCLVCHAIRETDIQGNANYVVSRSPDYLWQWQTEGWGRLARDFLIRTYPAQHRKLSKQMFKAPEYCAACHKQFIDQEVNKVGWVQLQNQYDNWAASHWNVKGDPEKTVECRECHMPLVDSSDPAAGDSADYNRTPGDGKHRSHRFVAANAMIPRLLKLPGWEEQVDLIQQWLQGAYPIPEIRDKWATGPIVSLELEVPERIEAGKDLPVRVVFTSNKVGHDFPTGPLDIIQSWLQLTVTDETGGVIYSTGTRDEKHFIKPGTFMFKAEPVDQYGNLIDRHNLWEMVGVRYRRALFPGYSDAVDFMVNCSGALAGPPQSAGAMSPGRHVVNLQAPGAPGRYQVTAALLYRKVDQFLLNFLLGEESGVSAPVMEISRAEATIQVDGLEVPPPSAQ